MNEPIKTIIKEILTKEINKINYDEKRDGKPRFNCDFTRKHPYLCLAMVVSYLIVTLLIYLTDYLGSGYLFSFTVLFIIMFFILLIEIKPIYKFEDIGVFDLRVCYNGEWFVSRELPSRVVEKILHHENISKELKECMSDIIKNKGNIDFYDLICLVR